MITEHWRPALDFPSTAPLTPFKEEWHWQYAGLSNISLNKRSRWKCYTCPAHSIRLISSSWQTARAARVLRSGPRAAGETLFKPPTARSHVPACSVSHKPALIDKAVHTARSSGGEFCCQASEVPTWCKFKICIMWELLKILKNK